MPNLVITGPCRSGTALFHKLINDCIPGAISTNEIVPNLAQLKPYFRNVRAAVNANKPIANRYARDGSLSDNSWRKGADIQARPVDKPLDGAWTMATKAMVGFMDHIQEVIDLGIPVVAIIRDPIYTIGSWSDPNLMEQTVGKISIDDLHPWWKKHPFPFTRPDQIGRRAEYWNFLASKIRDAEANKQAFRAIRYEQIIHKTKPTLREFCTWRKLGDPIGIPVLKSANDDNRYPYSDMHAIREAVDELCPARKHFGY